MKTFSTAFGIYAILAAAIILTACQSESDTDESSAADSTVANAAQEMMYEPQDGDSAIVYMHRFKPEYFEEARRITIEGFSKAAEEVGETRRTYFMVNPDSNEVIAVAYFHGESEAEKWMASKQRHAVLEQLDSLRSRPMQVSKMELERVHHHQGQ